MFKATLSYCLVLSLLCSNCFASSQEDLKSSLEALEYSLVVEWDQKDQAFLDAQIEAFNQKLQNVSVEELKAALPSAEAAKLSLLSNSELRELLVHNIKSAHGASWSGSSDDGAAVMLVIIIVVLIIKSKQPSYMW